MKLLQAAAAVLLVFLVAGCAGMKPPPPAPAATAASSQWARESPMVPPMTTYGCDSTLAMRMGKSC
jgi:hypothetical protein